MAASFRSTIDANGNFAKPAYTIMTYFNSNGIVKAPTKANRSVKATKFAFRNTVSWRKQDAEQAT